MLNRRHLLSQARVRSTNAKRSTTAPTVAAELDRGPLAQYAQAQAKLGEIAQKVRSNLGDDAIGDDGELTVNFREVPVGKEYLEAQSRAVGSNRSRADVEEDIYNHLHTFFNRYYVEGDFISQRRYSGNQRYAIPYNGEEVYLHWANSDQYYVKTDEYFRNYDWQAPNGVTVRFRLKTANVEQNNVKGDKRFFLPVAADAEWDADARAVTIPVEYRPLDKDEAKRHSNRDQQKKINEAAAVAIPPQIGNAPDALAALAWDRHSNDNGSVSHLMYHLRRYSARNNADYFIHKDLTGFLNQELDFYLKNEVLNLDNLAAAGQDAAEGWFQQLRLIKTVGGEIIDFLAQIEDFQKMLWEKRKFVTETQYCITLGNIGADFYPEIIANEEQWNEWHELFEDDGDDRSDAFLRSHRTLVLDTKHFCADFTNRLLASFNDLAEATDGLLVHGENWQALRLMQEQYTNRVQCVYIDPPYNSPSSEIAYKNGYKHSTWLSLLSGSMGLSQSFISDDLGTFICAIDENEMLRLGMVLDAAFSTAKYERNCITVIHNPKGIQGGFLSINNEYAFVLSPVGKRAKNMSIPKAEWTYEKFRNWGGESERHTAKNCFYPISVKDGKIGAFGNVSSDEYHPTQNVTLEDGTVLVYPIDRNGVERKWTYARQSVESITHLLRASKLKNGNWDIERTHDWQRFKTVWSKSEYIAGDYGSKPLNSILGEKRFDFPKAVPLVADCIRLSDDKNSLVLDYFAGSGTTGHAVINLNREDGGERKFILVEMGEYFDTVLLPRIKKVTFTPEWRNGKPRRSATSEETERSPRIVKYIRLESYEDALDSIEFDEKTGEQPSLESADEYLLKYLLRWETKDSETLLNVAKLTNPFTYRLRVHVNGERKERTVDLPETFNYLIGLNVRTRRAYDDGERRYLVYRGETRANPSQTVAIIWRATQGWSEKDFVQDRDFVATNNLRDGTDVVYVNGDSCIPCTKPIEPVFKARMFAGVNT